MKKTSEDEESGEDFAAEMDKVSDDEDDEEESDAGLNKKRKVSECEIFRIHPLKNLQRPATKKATSTKKAATSTRAKKSKKNVVSEDDSD